MSPRIEEAEVFPVLRGKVALVTGASQGMGKATARVFLKAGAKLVICDIKEDKGKETEKELSEFGEVVFVKADVSKSDEVENLVSQTVARFSRLDVAVNNAAMTADDKALTDFDESHWNKILNVNLTGTALCCKYEMQQMIKQGGKGAIVNISSTNAFKPPRNMPAYSASKIAVIGLTKHAAMEGGSHGIRVNCVAPGAIYTDMLLAALVTMGTTEEEFVPQVSHLNRIGMDHEVAQASLWLASGAASYVTGICLPVDGGYTSK